MAGIDVFELVKSLKSKVDSHIFEFLPETDEIPEIRLLYQMMRDYPSRSGKGLRPGLLLIFNRALGGDDAKALNTAAALELFQNWIVIHDDIEDQSDLRRGLPSLHIKHGVPLALNAGDALAGKMWQMLLKNQNIIGLEKTLAIIEEFLYMYEQTTSGQHIELSWVNDLRWDISPDDYFAMCHRKTAWYTCITPCWTGAFIAGIEPEYKERMINFGLDLGAAFQIQDDILNIIGDVDKYGKEIAGDIWEGKRTLVLIDLLSKCSADEKKSILKILNKPRDQKNESEINQILEAIRKYECVDYAFGISHQLALRARHSFIEMFENKLDDSYNKIILDLIDFMVNREL